MAIEHKDHVIYPTTFLQNAVVFMKYVPRQYTHDEAKEVIAETNSFFLENFGLNFNVDSLGKTFHLSSDVEDISYVFMPESAFVRVGRKNYTSFDASVMPNIYRLRNYIYKVLRLGKIEWLRVRKVNMFPVQTNDPADEHLFSSMEGFLLSGDMLRVEKTKDEKVIIKDAVSDIYYRELDDIDRTFRIVTGVTKDSEQNIYNQVLDISCTSKFVPEGIMEDKIEEKLTSLNQRLFDLYHWAVSSEVTEVMNTPKKQEVT
jgi:hypothetical protein